MRAGQTQFGNDVGPIANWKLPSAKPAADHQSSIIKLAEDNIGPAETSPGFANPHDVPQSQLLSLVSNTNCSPEHEHALRLTQALQHLAVSRVLGQNGLEAQQDLLHGLHELILMRVPSPDLGQHALRGIEGFQAEEQQTNQYRQPRSTAGANRSSRNCHHFCKYVDE